MALPTRVLLAARTNFQTFGMMQLRRDPDYEKTGGSIHNFQQMFGGYFFPQSTFQHGKPMNLNRGQEGKLEHFTQMGMRPSRKAQENKQWYREALGAVQYLDGYDYPELVSPEELLPESEAQREAMGNIPLTASGKAREFAVAVEALRVKPDREKRDIEALFAEYSIWTPSEEQKPDTSSENELLHNQPTALYEVLVLMCAETKDWVNVHALLREYGLRNIQFRSVVAAALFDFTSSPQMALSLFEVLKKENVRLHLHTYLALLRSFDVAEEKEIASTLNTEWHQRGEVTADMVDFIVDGHCDNLMPETAPYLGRIDSSDPKEDIDAAIRDLLNKDKALLR
eukprot:TRINITY_DN30392_c0_g1_i1.p1 TRINITY_DN30392_c0_g1~~TRINITY_DN30392_c0_g1_i1.p1  ORF type:complete len:360 (+),score=162.80 TRINITY_DN30392_c0_g1_i1:59-1081(+)